MNLKETRAFILSMNRTMGQGTGRRKMSFRLQVLSADEAEGSPDLISPDFPVSK
jgi:hypothetical protein